VPLTGGIHRIRCEQSRLATACRRRFDTPIQPARMSTSPPSGHFYCGLAPINSSCGRGQTRRRTPPRPEHQLRGSGQFQQVRDEKAQARILKERANHIRYTRPASVPRRAQHTARRTAARAPFRSPGPVRPGSTRACNPPASARRTPATDDASQNAPIAAATTAWPGSVHALAPCVPTRDAVNRLSEVAGAHYCTLQQSGCSAGPHRATWEERVSAQV